MLSLPYTIVLQSVFLVFFSVRIGTFISVFKRRTVLQYDRARVVFCTTSLPPLPAVYTINFAVRTNQPSVGTTLHESPRRKGHTGLTTLADCTMTILYCTSCSTPDFTAP